MSPLKSGRSKKVFSENVSEFSRGKTFAQTKKKFGKKKAMKQSIAVAMKMAGKNNKAYYL